MGKSRIPQELFDQVVAKSDIVDVISDYVQLSKAGKNYKGLCPFHGENTPSFVVSPDKGIYKSVLRTAAVISPLTVYLML